MLSAFSILSAKRRATRKVQSAGTDERPIHMPNVHIVHAHPHTYGGIGVRTGFVCCWLAFNACNYLFIILRVCVRVWGRIWCGWVWWVSEARLDDVKGFVKRGMYSAGGGLVSVRQTCKPWGGWVVRYIRRISLYRGRKSFICCKGFVQIGI